MSGTRSAVSDVDVDLGQLFGSLLRNWLRIALFAAVVTGGAFLLASMATPQYRAETRLLIEARESVFTRPNNLTNEADRPLLDEEAIASQVEVISSADILRDVADRLDLASREEFGGGGSTLGNLLVLVGLRSDPAQASQEARVLGAMRERLTVYRVDRSRVIVVQFSSEDPQLAASVPNAIADAYLAVQEQAKRASNTDATQWLEPEIADLRQRVREAEARVADYRAQADLFMGPGTAGLATQQLSELSTELSRVRAERSAAEARAAAIRSAIASGAQVDSMPEVLNSPLVQRLRERHAQLSSDRADLSTSLLGNHPRIRAIDAQIAETTQQLRSEMQKVLRSLENEASAAETRERQLEADLNTQKAETARVEGDEVELRALEREAAAQRALLESYLTRYREAAARADRNYLPADARIFARATPPVDAYFPKVMPIAAAAFVGSLLLAAIATLLAELFTGRAMRPAQGGAIEPVEQVAMPVQARQEPQVEQPRPATPVAEPVQILEDERQPVEEPDLALDEEDTTVELELEEPADTHLTVETASELLIASGALRAVFVSPEGDEAGATSVMVAREIADAGLRVIFLDLTWSGAPSATMLESARYAGITNLLASESPFTDIIHGDLYSDCHVIPVGTSDRTRAMRAADRLPIIMASLTTAYDVVVVECGPTDAEGIRRLVAEDTAVLVSVIDPDQPAVADVEADLASHGHEPVLKVTPVSYRNTTAPRGRSVA